MSRPGYIDSSRLEINLAIYRKGSEKFEVVVDPDLAVELRQGNPVEIREVLKSESIFSDAQKGMMASENRLKEMFGTSDPLQVASRIIKQGEIQLSAAFRRRLREAKKNRILDIIHRNSINPQTNTPHPRERLKTAMEETKVRIDEFKKAEDQVDSVLSELKKILPIRFELLKVEVLVGPQYAPQSYSILKSLATIEDTQWTNDGSLLARIKLPAGLQQDFFDRLNNLTHGSVSIKIMEK